MELSAAIDACAFGECLETKGQIKAAPKHPSPDPTRWIGELHPEPQRSVRHELSDDRPDVLEVRRVGGRIERPLPRVVDPLERGAESDWSEGRALPFDDRRVPSRVIGRVRDEVEHFIDGSFDDDRLLAETQGSLGLRIQSWRDGITRIPTPGRGFPPGPAKSPHVGDPAWGSKTRIRSCGEPVVLVDEPIEQVAPPDIALLAGIRATVVPDAATISARGRSVTPVSRARRSGLIRTVRSS